MIPSRWSDPKDGEAWRIFVETYTPEVYGVLPPSRPSVKRFHIPILELATFRLSRI